MKIVKLLTLCILSIIGLIVFFYLYDKIDYSRYWS